MFYTAERSSPSLYRPFTRVPSFSLHRWILLASLAAWVLVVPAAWADVSVPTPSGWASDANASRAALEEAEEWASATGLEATQVASPNESDAFMENLVVLLDRRPLRPEVLENEGTALAVLTDLADEIFDASAEPTSSAMFDTADTHAMRARWEVGDTIWDLVLVPAGAEHAIVVLKTRAANRSLHGDLIEDIAADLAGASAPIAAFPLTTWRWSLLGFWLLVAAVSHMIALRRIDHAGDQHAASRMSSIIVTGIAIVATGVTYAALGGKTVALELSGTSTQSLALEMLGAGLLAAFALVVLARFTRRRPERVESAPRTGVFSSEVPTTGPAGEAQSPRGSSAASPQKSPVPRPLGPSADADVGAFHRTGDDGQPPRPRGG